MKTFIPPWLKIGEQFRIIYKKPDGPVRTEVAEAIDYHSNIVLAKSGFYWNFHPDMMYNWTCERVRYHGILKHKTQALIEKTTDRLSNLTRSMTVAHNAEKKRCSQIGKGSHQVLEEMRLTIDIMNEALERLAQVSQLNKRT